MSGDEWGAFGSAAQQPIQSTPQLQPQQIPTSQFQGQLYHSNQFNSPFGPISHMQPHGVMGQRNFNIPSQITQMRPAMLNQSTAATSGMAQAKTSPNTTARKENSKTRSNDPLGFDVFADFKKESVGKGNSTGSRKESSLDAANEVGTLLDLTVDGDATANNGLYTSTLQCIQFYWTGTMQKCVKLVLPIEERLLCGCTLLCPILYRDHGVACKVIRIPSV